MLDFVAPSGFRRASSICCLQRQVGRSCKGPADSRSIITSECVEWHVAIGHLTELRTKQQVKGPQAQMRSSAFNLLTLKPADNVRLRWACPFAHIEGHSV